MNNHNRKRRDGWLQRLVRLILSYITGRKTPSAACSDQDPSNQKTPTQSGRPELDPDDPSKWPEPYRPLMCRPRTEKERRAAGVEQLYECHLGKPPKPLRPR